MRRLSIEEAAHTLGVSVSTIRRRVRDGALTVERSSTPQGFRYFVLLAEEAGAAGAQEPAPPADDGVQLHQLVVERDWLRQRIEALELALNREQEAVLRLSAMQVSSQRLLIDAAAPTQRGDQADQPSPASTAQQPARAPESQIYAPAPVTRPDTSAGGAAEAVKQAAKAAGLGKKQRRKLLARLAGLWGR